MSKLFDGAAANSSSDAVKAREQLLTVFAFGTFDTCTLKLQISPDKTNWFDLTDATFTEKGTINVRIPDGVYYRGDLSSVGGSTVVSLQVVGFKV